MYSSNCTAFSCTDLSSERTLLEQRKTIPLVWKIKKFTRSKWCKIMHGETICGPDFKFHPLNDDLWKLDLGLKRDENNSFDSCLSMVLRKVSETKSTAFGIKISWSAQTDQEIRSVKKKNVNVPVNVSYYLIFDNEMTDFFLGSFLRNDTYNMEIEIEIEDDVLSQTASSVTWDIRALDFQSSLDKGRHSFIEDMKSVLEKAEFTDVILISEGKQFLAHKAILAARTSVFKRMFQNQLSESPVEITDLSYDTLELLLYYIYSGRLVDLDLKSASNLFVASYKYAFVDLHHTCSLFLKKSLTTDNFLQILMMAHTHTNKNLKSSAVAYFSDHCKEICQKPD